MDLSKLTNPSETTSETIDARPDNALSTLSGTEKTDTHDIVEGELDENTTLDARKNDDQPNRSTSDYRRLYNYLLEKYRNAIRSTKVLEDFELYLRNLSKYQQIRNNMLVDTLIYLNEHETLKPVDPNDHHKMVEKLKIIEKNYPTLSDFVSKLRDLESSEDESNPRLNINAFHKKIGINDALSSDFSILENNAFPDLYAGNFDLLELVKKNPCFRTEITSLPELNKQIRKESVETTKRIEIDHTHLPRKKKKTVLSNSSTPQPSEDLIQGDNGNNEEYSNKGVKVENYS